MDDDPTIRDAVVNEIRRCRKTGLKFNAHKVQNLLLRHGVAANLGEIRKLRTQVDREMPPTQEEQQWQAQRSKAIGREAAERASAMAAVKQEENRRRQLAEAIAVMPDPTLSDPLFRTVSLRTLANTHKLSAVAIHCDLHLQCWSATKHKLAQANSDQYDRLTPGQARLLLTGSLP